MRDEDVARGLDRAVGVDADGRREAGDGADQTAPPGGVAEEGALEREAGEEQRAEQEELGDAEAGAGAGPGEGELVGRDGAGAEQHREEVERRDEGDHPLISA